MMRRILLAIYGLGVGACYATLLHVAVPPGSGPFPVRGLNLLILMGFYGWCCGKDPLLPVRRPLIEIPVLPPALLGALLAGCLFVVSFIVTQLANLVARTRASSRQG